MGWGGMGFYGMGLYGMGWNRKIWDGVVWYGMGCVDCACTIYDCDVERGIPWVMERLVARGIGTSGFSLGREQQDGMGRKIAIRGYTFEPKPFSLTGLLGLELLLSSGAAPRFRSFSSAQELLFVSGAVPWLRG